MMKKNIKYGLILLAVVFILGASWYMGAQTNEAPEQNISKIEDVAENVIKEKIPSKTKDEKKPEVVEGKPVKIEEIPIEEEKNTCLLTIDCSDILNDISSLKQEKHSLVSGNGIIMATTEIEFDDGESVFDILKRELRKQGIPLEFSLTPASNNAYIEGINNIYEFDCGERSGWKYSVNGAFLPLSCSDYKLKDGDNIVFVYKRIAY